MLRVATLDGESAKRGPNFYTWIHSSACVLWTTWWCISCLLCLEKSAAELTPFFPVLTPKSSTHRSWGQCLSSQDLSLSPLGTTLVLSLAPLTKSSQGFLNQLILKQRRNFKQKPIKAEHFLFSVEH